MDLRPRRNHAAARLVRVHFLDADATDDSEDEQRRPARRRRRCTSTDAPPPPPPLPVPSPEADSSSASPPSPESSVVDADEEVTGMWFQEEEPLELMEFGLSAEGGLWGPAPPACEFGDLGDLDDLFSPGLLAV
ncbi:hypothetical protein EJB05_02012, partial [Eragrostis curvula]